jgi:hypothetical protein
MQGAMENLLGMETPKGFLYNWQCHLQTNLI